MSQLAEQIEDALNIKEVMEHYGIQFDRRGYALCPFHKEKTPSLYIKKGRFTCYGCGAYGRVIDFVERYFGLTFGQAITRLNNDFQLGLTSERPTAKSIAMARKKAEERKASAEEKARHNRIYIAVAETYGNLLRLGATEDELRPIENWMNLYIELGVFR